MVSLDKIFRLDGKVALVTGGYGGIGEVVCQGLLSMGAKVAIAGHNLVRATECAKALAGDGHDAWATSFEATSISDTQRMINDVKEHFGHIDILVNCIGLQREEKAEEVTEEMFDYVLDVNLKSAMFQAQAVAREMIQQGTGGKQVHLGSVRSLLALRGRGFAAYCAAKGGLVTMCKQLSSEWASHGINVNVVAPTFIRTEQVAKWLSDPDFYASLISRIPLGRIGEPADVMSAVLFLVSPASNFITGQALYLDGGLTAEQ